MNPVDLEFNKLMAQLNTLLAMTQDPGRRARLEELITGWYALYGAFTRRAPDAVRGGYAARVSEEEVLLVLRGANAGLRQARQDVFELVRVLEVLHKAALMGVMAHGAGGGDSGALRYLMDLGRHEPMPDADLPDVPTEPPPPVHWNTRVLDGDKAIPGEPLRLEHTYQVETRLGRAPAEDAVSSTTVALGDIPDGKQVTFIVQCASPILRRVGEDPWTDRVEGVVTWRRKTGDTDPVLVELRPDRAGFHMLVLGLMTDNALRASSRVPLWVNDALNATVAPSPEVMTAPREVVAAAAITGPPAELYLELRSNEKNKVEIRAGARNLVDDECSASLKKQGMALVKEFVQAHLALAQLSREYRRPADGSPFALEDQAAMKKMAKVGARLHEALFGLPNQAGHGNLKDLARLIAATPERGEACRMQIVASTQPYPWGVLYDGAWRDKPLKDDESPDPSCFWGVRFRIDRAIHGCLSSVRAPVIRQPVRVRPCLNPHLDDDLADQPFRVVEAQKALFSDIGRRTAGLIVSQKPIEHNADLLSFFDHQAAPCDLLYFFCHATTARELDDLLTFSVQSAEEQARLVLDEPAGVTVAQMSEYTDPLADAPLVVLNACGSVTGDPAFASPLLLQFLEGWRASGVIGTDWEIPSLFADAFSRQLFAYFLRDRLPLGEALARTSADAFAEGNPFPLIYALYAPPDFVVQPAAATTAGAEP